MFTLHSGILNNHQNVYKTSKQYLNILEISVPIWCVYKELNKHTCHKNSCKKLKLLLRYRFGIGIQFGNNLFSNASSHKLKGT